jgi:hypothetical protein
MLQVFCLDVAKVDMNVAYTCMLQAYISSVFRCFIRMLASVSFGCCIYLQWFSNVFLDVFASVSDTCFRCFICLLLYVATVVSRCFKSRLSVANRMRVGNGRQRGRRPGWRARRPGWDEPTAGALSREPDTTDARSLCAAASGP